METTEKPDVREMVIVHRVFRREFGLLPGLITAVRAGDTDRSALLAGHLADLTAALHHHHETEDELLWPVLLERATLHTELVHRMESQHAALAQVLGRIDELGPSWAATADPAEGAALAAAVAEASEILQLHLGEEEAEILPLVREHLTLAEWAAIGERGAAGIQDKRKRLLFLGAILEDASPDERRTFLSHLPAPVRLLWKLLGHRQYDASTRQIRRG